MLAARNAFLFGLLSVATLSLSGCTLGNDASATEEVTKSFTVGSFCRIVVETFNGDIDVVTSEPGKVQARVTKRASGETKEAAEEDLKKIDVAMVQEGDIIRITARVIEPSKRNNRGAAVQLRVPAGVVLELQTANGKVNADGPLGDVAAKSTNGSILAKGSKGKLDLATSNGGITVQGGAGKLDLKSSNGPLVITSENVLVTAHTTNGPINFSGSLTAGKNSLHTTNGQIVLSLPADAHFRIDAQTSNGKIASDFTVTPSRGTDKNHLQGSVGDNPAIAIALHASNGSIAIKERK